ncbi:MAG: methyltransferase domain-containing protein [Spirochaetales bacterium]|nr:methyltransferase domain-containing protein [Spirochaetales bacterium]
MKSKRVVIVQCRLSSTRLPEKALLKLGEKSVLAWTLRAMHKVPAEHYFVATDMDSFEKLAPVCHENGFECYAGSLDNVLNRFTSLLQTLDSKTVIRATADNPFLFYEAAIESVEEFEKINKTQKCDYFTFKGLPHGSGIEVFSAQSLIQAAKETSDPYDLEHVGPALYNHQEKYKCIFEDAPRRYKAKICNCRTTIDTYSDYLRAISIVKYLGLNNDEPYTCQQILEAADSSCVKHPVILVPSVIKGRGTGHLRRCLSIARENNYFIYIPQDASLEGTVKLVSDAISNGVDETNVIDKLPDETLSPVIITDTFELTKNQIESFSNCNSLISIDEGSDYSDYCDYLLDIIPSIKKRIVNKIEPDFITKPLNVRENQNGKNNYEKILVCLGGEDPAKLTIPAVKAVSSCYPEAMITAVYNNSDKSYVSYSGGEKIEFVEEIENLREKVFEYDLVLTHYGLTAFEAMYAGCSVILLPTSKLHVELAKKYSFPFIEKSVNEDSLKKALDFEQKEFDKKSFFNENKENPVILEEFLKTLTKGEKILCPVCGKKQNFPDEVISRNETRTYRRCQNCGIAYMSFSIDGGRDYHKAYFFEEYKNQYGKTYKEDFESIKAQGKRRLSVIKNLKGDFSDKTLLDIGCAYGPFLSAANDSGLSCFGTDISSDAVDYVQNELKIPAACSTFPDINTMEEFGLEQFDFVSMWYVIEHFKNLEEVLNKVYSLVKLDGIFAFSTPSGEGISAKSDKDAFYKNSPADHYTIWEPSRAEAILKKFGFRIEKIISTGHHPERFPYIQKCGAKPGSLKWIMTEKKSRLLKLGDTMEIYCRKVL